MLVAFGVGPCSVVFELEELPEIGDWIVVGESVMGTDFFDGCRIKVTDRRTNLRIDGETVIAHFGLHYSEDFRVLRPDS
jgi:hypothetical protein